MNVLINSLLTKNTGCDNIFIGEKTMEKGLLKNKIITTLTLGFAVLTIHNLLFTASSSYHLFKQDYDKNHLQESDFACVQL